MKKYSKLDILQFYNNAYLSFLCLNDCFSHFKENKREVSNGHKSILGQLVIAAERYNPNNGNDDRFAKKTTSSCREEVKKEFTQESKHVAQRENLVENVSTIQIQQAYKEERPSNTSSSTDEIDSAIDESRTVRFRNNLFVVSIYSHFK